MKNDFTERLLHRIKCVWAGLFQRKLIFAGNICIFLVILYLLKALYEQSSIIS